MLQEKLADVQQVPHSTVYILSLCYDDGIDNQLVFHAESWAKVFQHIFDNMDEYEHFFSYVKAYYTLDDTPGCIKYYPNVISEMNIKDAKELEEICGRTYINGDSNPGIEFSTVELVSL